MTNEDETELCSACDGTGETFEPGRKCPACNGRGEFSESEQDWFDRWIDYCDRDYDRDPNF